MNRLLVAAATSLLLPLEAGAAVEWAEWSGYPAATRTGTFPNSATVSLFNVPAMPGVGSVAAGKGFTTDTPVPGMSDTGNPPYQQILTGTSAGVVTVDGATVARIDLSLLPDSAVPLFGIADLKFPLAIEFLDNLSIPINLTGVVLEGYNIHYPTTPPAISIADMWATLTPASQGNMTKAKFDRDLVNHLAPNSDYYNQTGLLLLTNLPVGTQTIKLTIFGAGQGEGLDIFVGADFSPVVEVTDSQGSATDGWIDFGTISAGAQSIERTITVKNPGDSSHAIEITKTNLDATQLTFTNNCASTLAAGASCTAALVFHPTDASSMSGEVLVDADGSRAASVSVTGNGTLAKTGDANGDGATKITDALQVLRIAVGSLPSTPAIVAACDMNGDNKITITDALAVLRKAVGL